MKRTGGQSKGGSAKRQRQTDMLQPGEYGIYATCPRRKEPQAGKEMKLILGDAISKYYPSEETEEDQEKKDEETKEESHDVEDEIAKEVAELKASTTSKSKSFRQIQLNAESLLFFKLKAPVVPSKLVEQICEELLESGEKKGRFVQRLVGVDVSCSPVEEQWMEVLKTKIEQYLGDRKNGTYLVNLTRRHFETFDRDAIDAQVAKVMEEHGFKQRYKDVDVVVHIYCFKNNMGLSLSEYSSFQHLAKYNLQMVYDKATGQCTALGREKP